MREHSFCHEQRHLCVKLSMFYACAETQNSIMRLIATSWVMLGTVHMRVENWESSLGKRMNHLMRLTSSSTLHGGLLSVESAAWPLDWSIFCSSSMFHNSWWVHLFLTSDLDLVYFLVHITHMDCATYSLGVSLIGCFSLEFSHEVLN